MELDMYSVIQRQNLFTNTLKSSFLRKISKYKNILLKNGIHVNDDSLSDHDDVCLRHSQSFEDHIELVLGEKSESPNARKTLWKIGSRVSTLKLFRWILQVVQRTKAARILHHLDGISADELETTILSVGSQISVAYEYQLVMLDGDVEIIKLAQHASACMITYLNSNEASFLPENLLQAILEIKPKHNSNKDVLKTRVVVHNNEPVCLKWHLSQVLKQTGLRIFVKTTEAQNHLHEHSLLKQMLGKASQENKPVMEQKSSKPVNSSPKTSNSIVTNSSQNISKTAIKIERSESNDEEGINHDEKHEAIPSNREPQEEDDVDGKQEYIAKPSGVRRKLNIVDMDFDKGVMLVTEHSVIASEFSAVDCDTSDFVDGGFTSIDEDFDSDSEPVPEIADEVMETRPGICQEPEKDIISRITISNPDGIISKPCLNDSDIYTQCNHDSAIANEKEMCNMADKSNTTIETSSVEDVVNSNSGTLSNSISVSTRSAQESSLNDSVIKHINSCIQMEINLDNNLSNIHHTDLHINTSNHISNGNHSASSDKYQSISSGGNQSASSAENQSASSGNQSASPNGNQSISPNGNQFGSSNGNHSTSSNGNKSASPNGNQSISSDGNQSVSQVLLSSQSNISCSSQTSHKGSQTSNNKTNISDICQISATDSGIYKFYGCFTPYGAKCRPEIYGFRGPLHVWNEKQTTYTLIYNDTVTVLRNHNREIQRNYRDYHQSYIPRTSCSHTE